MQDAGMSTVSTGIATPKPEAHSGFGIPPALRRRFVAGMLAGGDLVTVVITVGVVHLGAALLFPSAATNPLALAVAWGAALLAAQAWFGLYGSENAEPVDRLRRRTLATLVSAVAVAVWLHLTGPSLAFLPELIVGAAVAVVLGYYVEALARGWLLRHGFWTASTVLFGRGAACVALARSLEARPELGLRPVAILSDDGRLAGLHHLAGVPVISSEQANVMSPWIEVALCTSGDLRGDSASWLARLPLRQVFMVHEATGLQTLQLRTRSMGGHLGLELRNEIHLPRNLQMKRLVDLAVAIPAAIVSLPMVAMLALAVKLSDGGPAFYAQQRIGRNGRVFDVYKLRSMYIDAEARLADHLASDETARDEWERCCKLSNDPRILPKIGDFIRRSSLDELPQLWNVLRGEMSIVGPRPFPAYHSERFDAEFQALCTSVPPGLTGLWQVTARSDGDLAVQKRQDSFYIRNWSLWLDFHVLLQTLPAILTGRGAR